MADYLKFVIKLFILNGLLCAVAYVISGRFGVDYQKATILSFILSFLLFWAGFTVTVWSFRKSLKKFMVVLFGGMFVRFLVVAGIIFLVMRHTNYDIKYFISAFVIFYLISQAFEFKFVNKRLKKGSK